VKLTCSISRSRLPLLAGYAIPSERICKEIAKDKAQAMAIASKSP